MKWNSKGKKNKIDFLFLLKENEKNKIEEEVKVIERNENRK